MKDERIRTRWLKGAAGIRRKPANEQKRRGARNKSHQWERVGGAEKKRGVLFFLFYHKTSSLLKFLCGGHAVRLWNLATDPEDTFPLNPQSRVWWLWPKPHWRKWNQSNSVKPKIPTLSSFVTTESHSAQLCRLGNTNTSCGNFIHNSLANNNMSTC